MSAPLLSPRDLDAPLAWRHGEAISAGRFIAEAQALAARLPAQGRPVNLCQDRYHFALGLAAALLRGQTSLLPPNAMPETLRQVPAGGAAPYLLADDPALDPGPLPLHFVQRPEVAAAASEVPRIDAGLEALCLLTSGSTGAPQPHAKRWGALVANIGAEAERLAQMLGRPTLAGLTLVATVPPQHSYGLESSVLLALLGGCAFDAGRPYFPADIAAALARLPRPRALVTTPFHLKTLLRAGVEPPGADLLLSATAPLSPQLAAQAERELGAMLIEIYGCTEAGQVATRRTTEGDVWTALGELRLAAVPGSESDREGERVCVAGGHVTEPTPLADILELHSPTRFRLLGRANDLVHVAGKRSSLAHLNFHLNRIPGVDDGAFWLPDDIAEGVVRTVAFVVAPTLRAGDIVSALREHLEPVFIPRRIVHVDALPREGTGKLTAAALRRLAEAHVGPAGHPRAAAEAVPDRIGIATDHPAFAGHFPERPLLPGALLLALVLQQLDGQAELRRRLGDAPRIASAKFLAPVGPGAELRVRLQAQGRGVAFEVESGTTPVARGTLDAGPA